MKRFFAIVICAVLLLCILPVSAFAEEDSIVDIEQSDAITENSPTAEETVTESEISGDTAMPEEPSLTTTEALVSYVKDHLEELSVIITLILTVFYQVRKHGVLNKAIGTLNNNSVTIAENSQSAIQDALLKVEGVSSIVTGYKGEIETLLAEFRTKAEENNSLLDTLAETQKFLKTARLANIELANELAELLVLANIPNAKKEELYSRHLAAVGAISDAEKTEVNKNDNGQETE